MGVLGGRKSRSEFLDALFTSMEWCLCEHIDLKADGDLEFLKDLDALVLIDNSTAAPDLWRRQLYRLQKCRIGVLIMTRRPWVFSDFKMGVVCLSPDSSVEMAQGALTALSHMRSLIRRVDRQFSAMQRLSKTLQRQYEATDRELQLASRLQRDFLPKSLPHRGPFRFETMFRPCSWVSGDIFDIFRLDEKHWGFYLADAVGHGVAAGLLTMYIKYAIRPKRILRNGYELVPPSEVLRHLNDLLIAQGLPDSQFISGWYGMINAETLELKYAVAGHPPALFIDGEGDIRELHGDGCLLGINAGETFSDETISLDPGHRVLVYSDGLEPTLISHRPLIPQQPIFEDGIVELLRRPANDLISQLRERLDNTPGSLAQEDDVSVVIMDVEKKP
ncbi:MAG: serine/threonine-protein phosphatase [Phycisphaerales bacterium]|nr:serine/threonine-protein phosphatase [Phycisphaerales bacterium]